MYYKHLDILLDNFDRYIVYRKKSFKVKKSRLLEVEAEIRNIVGCDPEFVNIPDEESLKTDLLLLLDERRALLNWMFKETPEEWERMKVVNSRLFALIKELRLKMADACDSLVKRERDAFDDDYEVCGTLHFSYNGEDSVLPYKGSEIYGSDFRLMIAANNFLTGNAVNSGNCDNDYTWAHDTPFTEDPEVYICHIMAVFCRDLGYSAQDVLQLNDFWNEVHVRYQHFATQDPNYIYPREDEND